MRIHVRLIAAVVSVCLATGSVEAQTTPTVLNDWDKVKALHAEELIRVGLWASSETCAFVSATDADLICAQQHTVFFFPVRRKLLFHKNEVRTIRLSRIAASSLTGGAIGAGVGAGIGAAIDSHAPNVVEEGHLYTVLFALFDGALGLGVGVKTDFLAGPLIYRR